MVLHQDDFFTIMYGDGSEAIDIGRMVDAITSIDRGIGNSWNNVYTASHQRYGENWLYGYLDKKTITVEFLIIGDQKRMFKARTELARALDSFRGPQRLTFNDEPNRYYMAVTDGSVKFIENISKTEGRGTITFIVPDGLAHSTYTKVLHTGEGETPAGEITKKPSEGYVSMKVKNLGTLETWPKITIKNAKETGYYGLVNQNGVMEIGYKDSTEAGATVDLGGGKEERLINIVSRDASTTTGWGMFKNGAKEFLHSPHSDNVYVDSGGTLQYAPETAGYAAYGMRYMKNARLNTAYGWSSGLVYVDLPADSGGVAGATDWKMNFNLKYWAGTMGQTGHITIGVVDADNKLIAAYDVMKSDKSGNNAEFRMWFNKGEIKQYIGFRADNNESDQRYSDRNIGFNSKAGNAYIYKEGPTFTFGYAGKTYTHRLPTHEYKVAKRIFISAGSLSVRDPKKGDVAKMVIESLSFTKLSVRRLDLIENRYSAGSVVVVNMEDASVRFNPDATMKEAEPYLIQGDLVHGSTFFSIPPGDSELKLYTSDFTDELPDVTIEWDEHYL